MRILHAIHDFLPRHPAGSEIYALELCREQAARHHVSVLCAERDPSRDHGHVEWRVYDGLPVVEITNNWRCASFEETYRPPRITDQIGHVLRAIQPDVIHVHSLLNLSFDLTAFAAAQGIPLVATLHDYTLVCPSGGQRIHRADTHICDEIDSERCARCYRESSDFALMSFGRVTSVTHATPLLRKPAEALARRFPVTMSRFVQAARHAPLFATSAEHINRRLASARKVFDDIDLFLAPSSFIAGEFERLGIPSSKIRVSALGVKPLEIERSRDGGQPLRLGFVGTLVWHKGVHVLLDAVRALPSSSYELKIFGGFQVSPDYVADLRGRADGLPVRFMGAFSRDQLAEVYSQIDVLVIPSLWLENSPLVIHEAFMAGIPVVGARIGGITGLIEEGRTGLLYEPGSAAELSAALGGLIASPQRLADLERGVQAMPRLKSIAEDAAAAEAIYETLLRQRAGRAGRAGGAGWAGEEECPS